MFAHYLLPALLLLTTVDYSTAQILNFDVVTNSWAGSLRHVNSFREEKFVIPKGQCYGVLYVSQQQRLQCSKPGNVGVTPLYINVTVTDFDKVEIRGLTLDHALIVRKRPCLLQKAIVDVKIGCGPLLPDYY